MSNVIPKYLHVLLLITLLGGVVLMQDAFDKSHHVDSALSPFILPTKIIRVLDLGLDSAAASYLWLSAIQNLTANREKQFGSIDQYVQEVTDLDPRFTYPYAFATLVLPNFKLVNEAIAIGQKGLASPEKDFRIPYYLGIVYHEYLHDRLNAGKYFDVTSQMPNVPRGIREFALNYGGSPDNADETQKIWESVYNSSNDEVVKDRAKQFLLNIEIIKFLNSASKIFFKKHKTYPKTVQDLVADHIIRALPTSPFGNEYIIGAEGRVIVHPN